MFCTARDDSGLGSSETPPAMICIGKKTVAHVSYNGRVWKGAPQAWTSTTEEIAI